MGSAPQRYFAGRLPFSTSDSSDDEKPNQPSPVLPPTANAADAPLIANPRQPRRRIKARVVTAPAPTQPRGTDTGFLPISTTSPLTEPHTASATWRSSPAQSESESESESESGSESGSESESQSSSSSSSSSASASDPSRSPAHPESPPPSHPVFRPASQRTHSPSGSGLDSHPHADHDAAREDTRREEARRLLALAIAEDDRRLDDTEPQLPDDTDRDEDRDADFALWRIRELLRIRRDRDDQAAWNARRIAGQRQRETA